MPQENITAMVLFNFYTIHELQKADNKIYILKSEASVCATVSASINPLPSNRLRCCDQYIQCQRLLAVKPLNS